MSTSTTHAFQTEISQLLDLMINSLYSHKEIFLRELISNSSDAIDKRRFAALTDASLLNDDEELAISIAIDKDNNTIRVRDNGIGMSSEEVIENIGTIARSGTKKFIEAVQSQKDDNNIDLIGQFGVGFYATFMVADKVVLQTKKAGETTATRWESEGKGEYALSDTEQDFIGTEITLHLKEDCTEYADDFRLKHIINKYSEHIAIPIKMLGQVPVDEEGKPKEGESAQWEAVNTGTALWVRNKSEISDEEYQQFYQSLSYASEAPLSTLHHKVEGNLEYTSLFFIPKKAPFDLWNRDNRKGVKLYVKRIFIMDDAEHLLPNYLRFVKGVIDCADLPLNVSREILQSDRDIQKIKARGTKRVLDELQRFANDEKEQYQAFWDEFGQVIKEGIVEDMPNKDKITALLRFSSTQTDTAKQQTALADYVSRMQKDQEHIYYITGENYAAAKGSPHLERFAQKDIEVLLLTDPVDEWLVNSLGQYEEKTLQSVSKGDLALDEEEKQQQETQKAELQGVTDSLAKALEENVKSVRLTHRLTESPACLVADETDPGANLERIMKSMGQDAPSTKPILEINPQHPLIENLDENSADFNDWAIVLFNQAALSEGASIKNPAQYVKLVNKLLLK